MNLKNISGDVRNNEEWSSDRIKKLTMSKIKDTSAIREAQAPRRFTKRFTLIVAVVILTLTTAVFAVGYYFGSFDLLREVVGVERAEVLQPVEIGGMVRDLRAGISVNPQFRIELVAVGVDSNVVDIYLTLEDLVGNRLDGDFNIVASLRQVGATDLVSSAQFSNIINRTDDGIVTLHRREVFTNSVSGEELEFSLQHIFYGFRSEELEIDFDLSAVAVQTPAARIWHTAILPPHLHDINIALEGFESAGLINVSSIGIIDGRLHIQEQYDMTALHRWRGNKVYLIDPDGEIVNPLRGTYDKTESISFRIDEQGIFYNDWGYNVVVDFPYRENIFEADLERLSEYRLVAPFHDNSQATLAWSARFEIELPEEMAEPLLADGLEIWIERYTSTITQVQVTPFSVIIDGHQGFHTAPMPHDAMLSLVDMDVRVNMADGTSHDVLSRWARFDSGTRQFTFIRDIAAEPIDLRSVVSIEIDGQVIEFS